MKEGEGRKGRMGMDERWWGWGIRGM